MGHNVNEVVALTTPHLPSDEAFKENIILGNFNGIAKALGKSFQDCKLASYKRNPRLKADN